MKKKQIYGIVSIVTGVLLLLPLIMACVGMKAVYMGLNLIPSIEAITGEKMYNTFLDAIGSIGTSEAAGIWVTLMGIGSVITIILGLTLISNGVTLLVDNKNNSKYKIKNQERMMKSFPLVTLISGIVAVITSVCAIIYTIAIQSNAEYKQELADLKSMYPGIDCGYVIMVGTILLIIVGIAAIVVSRVIKKVKDQPVTEEQIPAQGTTTATKEEPAVTTTGATLADKPTLINGERID